MQRLMTRLRRDRSAQAMVEYGLIIGLVAVVVAGVLFALSGGLSSMFTKVTGCVTSPTSTSCPTASTGG